MEIVLLAVCYAVVALRIWTRFFLSKSFGYDDALIIFNLVIEMSTSTGEVSTHTKA
jgi:hypothetical protein